MRIGLLIILFFILCAFTGFAQTAGNEVPEVEDLYSLIGEPGFFEVLSESYRNLSDPKEALEIMQKYLPVLEEDKHRHTLLLDMARLEEQTGRLEKAQLHFQSAAFSLAEKRDYASLYNSMLLLIDLGEYRQALMQARQIREDSGSGDLAQRAKVQEARVYLHQDNSKKALEMAESVFNERKRLPADVLYNLWLVFRSLDDKMGGADRVKKSAEEVLQRLSETYPDSPEYRLIQGSVDVVPTVELSMGLRSGSTAGPESRDVAKDEEKKKEVPEIEGSRAIQTGSFRDADNAGYMQRELEREGFHAIVVQKDSDGKIYYRVLVPIAFGESEEKIILNLKEKGFEGYPVY